MNHRDLITALLLADTCHIRQINSALQERHTMTRLASVLEDLLGAYQARQLEAQQYTDLDAMTDDPEYRECFETAISEDSGAIFDAWRVGPVAALERLRACIKDEYREQEADWREKLAEGRNVNNIVDEARGK
ncbi:MAG: hypothetical protein ACQKBW_04390 [Puniceicoccales bacterium]